MKIKTITINKYKSFQKKETIPVDSKNLFIYGENGSGKSSFYYALKDFFQSSVEDIKMFDLRNREGVDYTEMHGSPPNSYSGTTRLSKIIERPYNIAEITENINKLYTEKDIAKITSEDVKKNMTLSGAILFDILKIE